MVQYAILYSVDWVWKLINEAEFKSSNNIGQIIIFLSYYTRAMKEYYPGWNVMNSAGLSVFMI